MCLLMFPVGTRSVSGSAARSSVYIGGASGTRSINGIVDILTDAARRSVQQARQLLSHVLLQRMGLTASDSNAACVFLDDGKQTAGTVSAV